MSTKHLPFKYRFLTFLLWGLSSIAYSQSTGYATSVTSQSGITNATNALHAADGSYARIYDLSDYLILDLGITLPAGSTYEITWRRKSSYGDGASAEITLRESSNNSSYTTNPFNPSTTSKSSFVTTSVTANVATRYIRFAELTGIGDDFDLDAVSYTIPAEDCSNGVDDDYDGLVDCDDPDCSATGNADAYTSQSGVTNPNNAIGAPDGARARLWDNGDQIVLDLTDEIPAGEDYIIRWRKDPGTSADPNIVVEESSNGSTWGAATGSPFTFTSTSYFDQTISASTNTRYLRFTTQNVYNVDLDAVSYSLSCASEDCSNGIDDDGDGLIDCADPDCSNSLTVNAGANTSICFNASTTLTATASGGASPYSFNWDNGLGPGSTHNVSPASSQTYRVTVSDNNGCTATSEVTITVAACPEDCTNGIDDDGDGLVDCNDPDCSNGLTVNAGTDEIVCAGTSINISASASGGDGIYTYSWDNGLGNGASKTVSPLSTTTYRVTVTDGNGCSDIDDIIVSVISSTTANVSGDVTVCSGVSTTLNAIMSIGHMPLTYTWSNGLGTGDTKTVSPASTTTYSVTVTGATGCTDVGQMTVFVNETPSADAGTDITMCEGESRMISVNATGGTTPYNIIWNNGLGSGAGHSISPASNTTYHVTVTSANGCNATDQIAVTVQNCSEDCSNGIDDDFDGMTDCDDPDCGPTIDVGSGSFSICDGGSITLSVTATGGQGSLTYTWDNGLGTGNNKTVSPTSSTTYTVTVTAGSGCSDEAQITVNVSFCGEDCTDGVDNDGDGLIDCDDPDCTISGAPTLVDDNYFTCPGLAFSQRVTYNDANLQDPSFSIYSNPSNGSVTIDQTGKFTYLPFGFECSTDVFVYEVCNQTTGCCSQATVNISLEDNTPPVLNNVPADVTYSCDEAVPDVPLVQAFDECPGVFIDFSETSTQSNLGGCANYTLTRTWAARDFCGNETIETQTITVTDLIKPEIFQLYTLESGQYLVAGNAKNVTERWKYVPFPITFNQMPIVLNQLVTENDNAAVSVQMRNISTQGFEVKLSEEENGDNIHGEETVSWVAIEQGSNLGTFNLESGTLSNVDHQLDTLEFDIPFAEAPLFWSSVISNNEADPVGIRHANINAMQAGLFLQEETSSDAETEHANESVSYLAMSNNADFTNNQGDVFGETGAINITNAWTTISFSREYTKPVAIVGGVSNNDTEPVQIRVRNLTGNTMEVRLQEWNYQDGNHGSEAVSWMVVEGSIPGNSGYYCQGKANNLKPNINVFAIDNCDNMVSFGYNENESIVGGIAVNIRTWMAIDDCGNTNVVSRFDTCGVAAIRLKAMLTGPLANNNSSGDVLMNDDLRVQELVPMEEPFSSLPSFPHVEDMTPDGNDDDDEEEEEEEEEETGTTITICQNYGETNEATVEIPFNLLQTYLDQGAVVGECAAVSLGNTDLVQICHASGSADQQTMYVPARDLAMYLAKGGVLGSCSGTGNEIPIDASFADYRTISSGEWTDPNIWQGGSAPPTDNINNKLISIEHNVVVPTGGLEVKNWSTLWITHGALTVRDGDFENDKSEIYAAYSTIVTDSTSGLKLTTSDAKLWANDCVIITGNDFVSNGGKRKLESVRLNVTGGYQNNGGRDTLNNVCAVIDGYVSNAWFGKMHLDKAKFHLPRGSFYNILFNTITGDSIVIFTEDGSLVNYGFWTAGLTQYCVADTMDIPFDYMPGTEACANIMEMFNPCDCYEDVENGDGNFESKGQTATNAGTGELDPDLVDVEGDDAIVDWMLVELRDTADQENILGYATVALQRDGDVVSETGEPIITFPEIPEGEYYVVIRHRNHLGIMTESPMYLSAEATPFLDLTDESIPLMGGADAGQSQNGIRTMWAGDFSEDNQVIYQGPNNDIFHLFSRVLSDDQNVEYLANFIIIGYELTDLNLDGQAIYQGPNNDRSTLLYHSVLSHPANSNFLANYIVKGMMP